MQKPTLEEIQERCAKRLYKSFPGDIPWKKADATVREGTKRMATCVLLQLFEEDPTEIALFFVDGRPL